LTSATQSLTVSKTFTADSTTNSFTATGHGFTTGDGPLRVSNSGGALPNGLTAGTDYWVTVLTVNTFTLSTSFLGALAGTTAQLVIISTNGTGTQTIASTGSTVRPNDVTISRNLIVSGHIIKPIGKIPRAGSTGMLRSGTATIGSNGSLTTSAAATILYTVPLEFGQRLQSIVFASSGDGAVDVTSIKIDVIGKNGSISSTLATTSLTNVSAIPADTTLTPSTPYQVGTVDVDEIILLTLVVNAANFTINHLRFFYDVS
jgi:hypothetical protein